MDNNRIAVLLIEDDPNDARLIQEMLVNPRAARAASDFQLECAARLASGLAQLVNNKYDVILLDLSLPDGAGLDTIASVRTIAPNVPIVSLTEDQDESLAVEAMQQGTQDILVKGKITHSSLVRAIRHAIERQRMVAELAQKAIELEVRNRELDEFAHTVAHQVQGLLSQMVGYTGYIDINYGEELNDEVHALLKRILQSGHKMNNVISELLLLASVRKGELAQVPMDMARIVSEAKKRLQFQIEEMEASLEQPDEWPIAMGYPPWIEEVWVNYISNALKYGGPAPPISLGAEALSSSNLVRFWVRDWGPGIAAADQQRLFRPLTRLRQIRARGEGLGLAIVRRIVEKCGGEVGVESQLGQGSKFWFTLPEADLSAVSAGEDNLY